MSIIRRLVAGIALAVTLGLGAGTAVTVVGGTAAYAGSNLPGPPAGNQR